MKRVLGSIILSGMVVSSLLADVELTLIDKDGNQTSQCVKSYSFSNNLESIAKQKGVSQDVYSTTETLTNKLFMGKPVYRKIVDFGDQSHLANDDNKWYKLYFNIENVDTQLSVEKFGNNNDYTEYLDSNKSQFRAGIFKGFYSFVCSTNQRSALSDLRFVVEYTKTTDVANTSPAQEFKSYIHYIPSSSATGDVITVDLEETGVRLLKDYTYDSTADSCTANN